MIDRATNAAVPLAIVREVVRQQEALGWPEVVPAYAEVPRPGGKVVFKTHAALTVADCEQLVEHHARQARAAIARFTNTESPTTAKSAGWHILRTRLYRCEYLGKTEQSDPDEQQFPFANGVAP